MCGTTRTIPDESISFGRKNQHITPEKCRSECLGLGSSWKVEYSEDNGQNYRSMFRSLNMYDITAYNAFGAKGDNTFPVGRTWIQASESDHMFYCRPSIPYNQLKIRVIPGLGICFRRP